MQKGGTTRGKPTTTLRGKGAGRGRGNRGRSRDKTTATSTTSSRNPEGTDVRQGKLRKLFNMCTYKIHALGHYVAAIARFGTTDGYSTQVVCTATVTLNIALTCTVVLGRA